MQFADHVPSKQNDRLINTWNRIHFVVVAGSSKQWAITNLKTDVFYCFPSRHNLFFSVHFKFFFFINNTFKRRLLSSVPVSRLWCLHWADNMDVYYAKQNKAKTRREKLFSHFPNCQLENILPQKNYGPNLTKNRLFKDKILFAFKQKHIKIHTN